ncbi:hypothetical protein STA3757_11320 [Stanieria sp. NIES-3757]|nr:hypothetical protein STA3757_11320 [Stanieria sp. NIES-3757]
MVTQTQKRGFRAKGTVDTLFLLSKLNDEAKNFKIFTTFCYE